MRFIRGTPTNYSQVGGAGVGREGGKRQWSDGGGAAVREGGGDTLLRTEELGSRKNVRCF